MTNLFTSIVLVCQLLTLLARAPVASGTRPLRVDNETGHIYQEWEKYVLVTQFDLSSFDFDKGTSQSMLLAASTRVFSVEHSKGPGRLRSYVTFSSDDFRQEQEPQFNNLRNLYQPLQLPLFFRESGKFLPTTFLETFREAATYHDEGFEHLIYVSPTSVLLTDAVLRSVYDSEDSPSSSADEVIHCNALPYSMALLLELFPYSVHALGLSPETVQALQQPQETDDENSGGRNAGFCGADVFVLPTGVLDRVRSRVEAITVHALQFEGLRTSPLHPRVRAYFYSIVLLNMALLEENIRAEHIPLLNDLSSPVNAMNATMEPLETPSSGLLVFPPPLSLEHIDFQVNSDLVDAAEGSFVGVYFSVDASGAASSCRATIIGLVGAGELRERWDEKLSENTFCLVAGQLMAPVAKKTYMEVNSYDALLRAEGEQAGSSFALHNSCEDLLVSPAMQGREAFLSPRNTLQCMEGDAMAFPDLPENWASPPPSFIRLSGCLDQAGMFRLGRPLMNAHNSAIGEGSSFQCAELRLASGKDDQEQSGLEVVYEALLLAPTLQLPCLLVISPAPTHTYERERFGAVMKRVGMAELRSPLALAAIGPQCTNFELSSLSKLMPRALSFELLSPVLKDVNDEVEEEKAADSMGPPEPHFTFASGGVGMNLLRDDHRIATSIENCLPRQIFRLLYGRLKHRGTVGLGANSHFVPFDGSAGRTVVEKVILKYLAPLVVGPLEDARRLGFVGAEWWIQHRETESPKEYHYDSALTWCRDNGWTQEQLGHCPFYPQIGSIFYLTATGGPTAVFDEHTFKHNPVPPIPEQVAISFPQKNRMGLFKGNRYHGVLYDPRVVDNNAPPPEKRLTLLINYWRMRDVGENFTHILPQEDTFLRLFDEYKAIPVSERSEGVEPCVGGGPGAEMEVDDHLFNTPPKEVQFQTVPVENDILDYLEFFKEQTLAPDLFEGIAAAHSSKLQEEIESTHGGHDATHGKAPVAILSFPKNSSHSTYCKGLIRDQNMTLIRFTEYGRDPQTGMAIVHQLGTIESHEAWRASWPHMPEDHEQQVRDMFELL
eukprot:CAMPEP_0114423868 /NCGR_PEP_ID=MMETSP0103-20121206/6383_1 /TAXON_ID=37642 ORGANISM="Paraphysomonas imperforata, Strain PA2" /NCGR_SAMPLE_ID=MMETSP0103 /ASSEMBLY_ACC=CAM_ASM_000201 /LENGTH=1059 /DNA_ID=CAMNT_0001592569 /DNA_START=115 /DNA_END=3294 /DNA_ORIENTATION=+